MKKRFAIALVASIAAVVLAVSFTACGGGSGDVKKLYDAVFELNAKEVGTTTLSAVELDEFDGTNVEVSGRALIVERTDPDTYDVNYELWVDGTSQIYSGQNRPYPVSGADWCWYVDDNEAEKVTVFTVDDDDQYFECKYDGVAPTLEARRNAYDGIEWLSVNGYDYCEYHSDADSVIYFVETGAAGDATPTLDQEGVFYQLEEVDIEVLQFGEYNEPKVFKVYDKSGKLLRVDDIGVIQTKYTASVVAMTKKAVILEFMTSLPDGVEDYDYELGGRKFVLDHYKYDWKKGEVSEIELDFLFGVLGEWDLTADIFSRKVSKIKSSDGPQGYHDIFFDADMNVVYDLNEMVPEMTDYKIVGDYLILEEGNIEKIYNSDGELVSEYMTGSRSIDESGLFVKRSDYFSFSGEYLFTLGSDGASRMASVPGRLYYTEARVDRDGEPELDETGAPIVDFKVYDVAAGKHTTICSSDEEYASFFANYGVYIVVDKDGAATVYDMSDGSELIDFETNDPTSVDFRNFGDDLLIEYTVTHRQGSVETDEMRYILIDVERQFN